MYKNYRTRGWIPTIVIKLYFFLLFRYYDLPINAEYIFGQTKKPELTGSFAVQNVTFSYPRRPQNKVTFQIRNMDNTEFQVAKNLCISANAGQSIALVGPSGEFLMIEGDHH